ncbi:MAG: phosphatase PAP2 family protein [Candidatus Omnitrophota bacterium]|nr:phosphatase PAP2 family protein [Candidatus Omnitrophota bacterium]
MNNITDLFFIFGAKYLFLFVVVIGFAWFLIQPKSQKREILIFACICLALIFVIFKIAGHLYYNPRPFIAEHFKPLIYHKVDNGFPSQHELLVSAISAIIFVFSWRTGFVLGILSLFVGISRVYVGVHHVIDIFGSMVISIVSVVLVYFVWHLSLRHNDTKEEE